MFTSTRADVGALGPVINELASSDVTLQLIVTGTHLTGDQSERTELRVPTGVAVERLPLEVDHDEAASFAVASAELTRGLVPAMTRLRPDVLLVLGDRWELMPVATTAVLLQVPLAHLHGGEVTEGAMDERFRHAITKLADLHFCADEESRQRLLQLGEEPWRITLTGAPALDRLREVRPWEDEKLADLLGAPIHRPFALLTYHPPTVDRSDLARRTDAVCDAAATGCASVLATHPGPDPGNGIVRDRLLAAAERHENFHVVPQLGPDYPAVLASCDVLIGNSSSGLFEAVSFGVPVVNVGSRQQGRKRPGNVIDVEEDAGRLRETITTALSPEFAELLNGLANPFGDGHASKRIAAVLRSSRLERLALKRFVDRHDPSL